MRITKDNLNRIVGEGDDILEESFYEQKEPAKKTALHYVKRAIPYAVMLSILAAASIKIYKQDRIPPYVEPKGDIFEEELS